MLYTTRSQNRNIKDYDLNRPYSRLVDYCNKSKLTYWVSQAWIASVSSTDRTHRHFDSLILPNHILVDPMA